MMAAPAIAKQRAPESASHTQHMWVIESVRLESLSYLPVPVSTCEDLVQDGKNGRSKCTRTVACKGRHMKLNCAFYKR